MLEVRLAQGPGGEDDHPGLVHPFGGGRGHAGPDGAEEPGQALHPGLTVEVGEDPGEDGPVDQGVPEARRRLGPVADGPELARRPIGPRRRR